MPDERPPGRESDEVKDSDEHGAVVMVPCHGRGRSQRWRRLSTGQLQHAATRRCLRAGAAQADVRVVPCSAARDQLWHIDYTEDNNFHASTYIIKKMLPVKSVLRTKILRDNVFLSVEYLFI